MKIDIMNKKLKTILLLTTFFLSIEIDKLATATEVPSIYFNQVLKQRGPAQNDNPEYEFPLESVLGRYLGKSKQEISKNPRGIKINVSKKLINKYDLLILSGKKYTGDLKGVYIFENNNYLNSIGYCLIEKSSILGYEEDDSLYYPPSEMQQIKQLGINKSFFKNEIKLPANTNITLYEKAKNGFIERYGVLRTDNGRRYLVIDSFYPKEIDEDIKPYIFTTLNKIFNSKRSYLNNK